MDRRLQLFPDRHIAAPTLPVTPQNLIRPQAVHQDQEGNHKKSSKSILELEPLNSLGLRKHVSTTLGNRATKRLATSGKQSHNNGKIAAISVP